MAETLEFRVEANRISLAIIGGLAGLGLWLFAQKLDALIANQRLYLFLFSSTLGFFATFLAMSGPLSLRRAAISAFLVALPSAGLLTWASLRFDEIGVFLKTIHPIAAYIMLLTIPLPFLIAAQTPGEGWRSYPALFNHAWTIVVRYAAAWLFVAVFWGVVTLSVALFRVIGLRILEDFLEIEYVPYVLTGVVLGLALAVVNELSDYVSPYLILRLLRLFLPVVLVVVAVFVVALPVNGMSGVFRGLSVASVLLAMALGGITLVSTAVDKTDDESVQTRGMRLMTQLLALLLPVLSALAIMAVMERVRQYGWTPDRLAAASVAAVVAAYAMIYTLAVILRRNWMERIRKANTYMALLVVLGAALWLTPVMNPQSISTKNQIGRFFKGRVDAANLDLWTMAHEWGRAGKKGVEILKQNTGGGMYPELKPRLEHLGDMVSPYGNVIPQDTENRALLQKQILDVLPVRPKEGGDVVSVLGTLPGFELARIWQGCQRKTARGNPGCVLLHADLIPQQEGDEVVLWAVGRRFYETVLMQKDGTYVPVNKSILAGPGPIGEAEQSDYIDAAIAGEFSIEPAGLNALHVKDRILMIAP